jgi:hypothetical protein
MVKGIKTALAIVALAGCYCCNNLLSDKAAVMRRKIDDVRQAAYDLNKSHMYLPCEAIAYSIAYLVSDNKIEQNIVEIKSGNFYHVIFAFKDKKTGLFGCGNNTWFGKNGFVEAKYKTIDDMARDCVEKYINKDNNEKIDVGRLRCNVLKNIPEKELKENLDMLINLHESEIK